MISPTGKTGSNGESDKLSHEHTTHRAPPTVMAEDTDLVDLEQFFATLYRQLLLILLTTVLFALGAWAYICFAKPTYEATSLLEHYARRPRITSKQGAIIDDERVSMNLLSEALNTQCRKLQSPSVRHRVIEELRSNTAKLPADCELHDEDLEEFIEEDVRIDPVTGTALIDITAKSRSPEFARAIADTYARVAIDSVNESTRNTSLQAVQWLQEQTDHYEEQVLRNEQELIDLRRQHNIENLYRAKQTAEQSLLTMSRKADTYEAEVGTLNELVEKLDQIDATPEGAGTLPSTMPRVNTVQKRLNEYIEAARELDRILPRYTEKHPSVTAGRTEVDAARQELEAEVHRARQTAAADLALAEAYRDSVTSNRLIQLHTLQNVQEQIDAHETAAIPLEKAIEASRSSYKGLLQRIEEARMAADEKTSLVTLAEQAETPAKPVWPKTPIVFTVGIILGVAAGVLLALVQDTVRDRICTVRDIETEIGGSLLATIALAPELTQLEQLAGLKAAEMPESIADSLTRLRASLEAQGHKPEKRGWVLLVTGAEPADGKTTISICLALTMAHTGKKVLLIDGDLHRSRHHEVFDLSGDENGLLSLLSQDRLDEQTLTDSIRPTKVDNLYVVDGLGNQDTPGVEALESEKLQRLLALARNTFDIVVIDSPPIAVRGETFVLGRVADDVIFACRHRKSRKRLTKRAIADLARRGCETTGIVLNAFRGGTIGYSDGYGKYRHYRR